MRAHASAVLPLLAVGSLLLAACGGPGDSGSTATALNDGADAGLDPLDTCTNRPSYVTQVNAVIQVSQYGGLQTGRNGDHELADGTILTLLQVASPAAVDTSNVQVAMNVASSTDPSGLPSEVPLAVGDTFEVEGEYIPASHANLTVNGAPAAVIHFTHTPCGNVTIGGTTYQ